MIRWNLFFEVEKVEQLALIDRLATHHDRPPSLKASGKRNHDSSISTRPFSTGSTHSGHRDAFAERDLWNVAAATTGLICLDAREVHHLAPLLGFVGDEPSKVGGRADKRCASEVSQPRLDFGIGEARVDLLVELLDDLGWRGLRCADAKPETRFVARHKLSQGRDVRQYVQARRASDRERAQPASPDIVYLCARGGGVDLR